MQFILSLPCLCITRHLIKTLLIIVLKYFNSPTDLERIKVAEATLQDYITISQPCKNLLNIRLDNVKACVIRDPFHLNLAKSDSVHTSDYG